MRGTWIRYGDVVMKNVLVRQWSQEAIYEDSDTDLRCMRHVLTVEAHIVSTEHYSSDARPQPTNRIGVWNDEDNDSSPDVEQAAALHYLSVRAQLLQPRQAFEMQTGTLLTGAGGVVLLSVQPMPDRGEYWNGFDIRNGPKPRACNITKIIGDQVLSVEWTVEVNILECTPENTVDKGASVLTNRWSLLDDIDQNFATTRIISGRLTISNGNLNPHMFRGWVVPRLQDGFRREKMHFLASQDGLQLDYTITDREIGFSAPKPATSWSLRHTETAGDGKMCVTSCDVTLSAPRDVSHAQLVLVALRCVRAKCWRDLKPEQYIVDQLQFIDHYADEGHGVQVIATVRRIPPDEGVKDQDHHLVRMVASEIGKPISAEDLAPDDYDSNKSSGAYINDPLRVEGPLPFTAAFATYLQSACNDRHATGDAEEYPIIPERFDRGTTAISAAVVEELPKAPETQLSPGHYSFPYTHHRVDSKYLTDDHTVGLPIAAQMPSSTSSSSGSSGSSEATGSMKTQSFVLLAPPTSRRIFRIESQRLGRNPELPAFPKTYDVDLSGNKSKAFRLRHVVTPRSPERQANGAMLYSVAAEVEYGLEIVADLSAMTLPIGPIPWLITSISQSVLSKDAIQSGVTIDSVLGLDGQSDPP